MNKLTKEKKQTELFMIEELERLHKYESPIINSALGICKEVIMNLNREKNSLPSFSENYLREKMQIILNSIEIRSEENVESE